MDEYEIRFATSATKEFEDHPAKLQQRFAKAIDRLTFEPRHRGIQKLEGAEDLYRVRVGDYRIVHAIDDEARLIHILRVRHR